MPCPTVAASRVNSSAAVPDATKVRHPPQRPAIHAQHKVARVLKLRRHKERRARVFSLPIHTLRFRLTRTAKCHVTALRDLARPVIPTWPIRLAPQKVFVLPAHKLPRVINRIRRRCRRTHREVQRLHSRPRVPESKRVVPCDRALPDPRSAPC